MPNIISKRNILIFTATTVLLSALAFVANPALAFTGEAIVGGLSGGLGAMFTIISQTAYWVAGGIVGLTLVTSILQWLIIHQTEIITFDNTFIKNGMAMTQGLADMLLILAFVVASFCIIFKAREFEAKRIVGTLVLVAIATRFGKLVVQVMVDIGNVAINTIVGTNNTLLWDATKVLLNETLSTLASTITDVILPMSIAYAVPYVNILSLGATLYGVGSAAAVLFGVDNILTNAAGGFTLYVAVNYLLKWIFQIFACYMLIGVYINFIILFVARIVWLQILTVISPLAIMSLALPQTKQYFKQWWQALVKWTFVGVWTLFFLMLGLGSAGFLVPANISVSDSGSTDNILKMITLSRYMLTYLFLILYLAIVKEMSDKDAGMSKLFSSAMTGVGAAVFVNAIKPAANAGQSRAIQSYMNKRAQISELPPGQKPSFLDNLALHGSGFMANVMDEKQISNAGSMFSGDSGKAQSAAKDMAKTFNLGKPSSVSSINPLIDSKISEVGKDFNVEKIIAMGGKANLQQAVWAMKNAKAEDMPALIKSFGKDGNKYLNYAINEKMLSPTMMQTIARNSNALDTDGPSALKDYLIGQDHNNSVLDSVKKFNNLRPDAEIPVDLKDNVDSMVARAQNLKGVGTSKDSFRKLPDSMFDDVKDKNGNLVPNPNLVAMLMTAPESVIGYAESTNTATEAKLRTAAKANFEQLAKANPEFVKAVGRKSGMYQNVIPENILKDAKQKATEILTAEKQAIESDFASKKQAIDRIAADGGEKAAEEVKAKMAEINNEMTAAIKKAESNMYSNEDKALQDAIQKMTIATPPAQAAGPATGPTIGTGPSTGRGGSPSQGFSKYGD